MSDMILWYDRYFWVLLCFVVNFKVGMCCWDSQILILYQTIMFSYVYNFILLDSNKPYPTSDMLFSGNPVTTVADSRFLTELPFVIRFFNTGHDFV